MPELKWNVEMDRETQRAMLYNKKAKKARLVEEEINGKSLIWHL